MRADPNDRLELGYSLVDDLQVTMGEIPPREEQASLRVMIALRAIRAATERCLQAEELDVLEFLLARWWRAWSVNGMHDSAADYGVRVTAEVIAQVCGLELQQAVGCLARLTRAGLVEVKTEAWDRGSDEGPEISLVGVLEPILSRLEPQLFRELVERHKARLSDLAWTYSQVFEEELESAEEHRAHVPQTQVIVDDWKRFRAGPGFTELLQDWGANPTPVYAWLDELAALLDRVAMVVAYPNQFGNLRKQLAKLDAIKIALLSERYDNLGTKAEAAAG